MLLTKEVEVKLNGNNIKWFENKGYQIPRIKDKYYKISVPRGSTIKVKIEDLSLGNDNIKVCVICDMCGEILNISWRDYIKNVHEDKTYYCLKCAMKKYGTKNSIKSRLEIGKSFEQWCIENNRQDILDRWDYELNDCKPSEIGYTSRGLNKKGYYLKCPNNIHASEQKKIGSLVLQDYTLKCNQCNSVKYKFPNLVDYFLNQEEANNSIGSGKEVLFKCPDCGYIKKMKIATVVQNGGLACPQCSDGFSYPNKLAFNLLNQLNIKFISEYAPNWIKPRRYDFYFKYNNKRYILEMDGGWHKKDNKLSGQTAEQSKQIDLFKDEMALKHNIIIIRIDCYKSDLKYIKNNILNSELSKLFNLSNINWNLCHENACDSLIKIACNIWNDKYHDVKKISKDLNINRATVVSYLKKGAELKLCDYKVETQKTLKRVKIICYNTKEIFDSVKMAEYKYNIHNISNCLNGKCSSSGVDEKTGEKLQWLYYIDYLNGKIPPPIATSEKSIICINTGEIFDSSIKACYKYNIDNSSIGKCCKGDVLFAGIHPVTDENLTWIYYDDFQKLNLNEQNQIVNQKLFNARKYMVVCKNTNEVFINAKEASNKYCVDNGSIIKCCKNKQSYAGKHPKTEESLKWIYYNDYVKLQEVT